MRILNTQPTGPDKKDETPVSPWDPHKGPKPTA